MIEISHNQARRLIRESLDDETSHRVSTEQWASLQLHLEGCAECRSYADTLNTVQKGLKRSLHQRWDAGHALTASGKGKAVMEDVQAIRSARRQHRKMALYALGGFVLLLSVLFWRGYQVATAPLPTATPVPTEFGATATATPIRFQFRGVVAMDVMSEDGTGEIYLFNSGSGPSGSGAENLTNHPANDRYPSWSPDGEWIAFLSNRDAPADRPDKLDVYVMHISGSQLTRLTNDPNITYEGPISWQLDGGWLGLIGHNWADPERARFVYLVPTGTALSDGSGARPLGLTAGAQGPVRFSPGDLYLSYRQPGPNGSEIMLYDRSFGRFVPVTRYDLFQLGLHPGSDGAYGWSGEGRRLIYMARGEDGAQIKSTTTLTGDGLRSYHSAANPTWEIAPNGEFLTGASFSPVAGTNLFAYLRGQQAETPDQTCAILHIRAQSNRSESLAAITVPNLCVLQNIGQENWIVQDDPWIVVLAQPQENGAPGLYAIRILPNLSQVAVERLADVRAAGAETPEDAVLPNIIQPGWIHARPSGLALNIQPRAVAERDFGSAEPVETLPVNLPGRLVYSQISNTGASQLVSSNADGRGRFMLTPATADVTCPAVSPDGLTIAMLSNQTSRHPMLKEVVLTDSIGGNARPLTQLQTLYPYTELGESPDIAIYPTFDCPVWSPDGSRLAAVVKTGGNTLLAVIPAVGGTGGTEERYYPIQPVSSNTPILWLDEQEIAMVYPGREGGSSARIVTVNVDAASGIRLPLRTVAEAGDWTDIYGMFTAPLGQIDSDGLVYFGQEASSYEGTILTLHIEVLTTGEEFPPAQMPASLLRTSLGSNKPFLTYDGRIAFFQRFPHDNAIKTRLMLYNPQTRILDSALQLPHTVFDSAASPDGTWVAFTTESGLYMVEIDAAAQDQTEAVFLAEGSIREIDWR